MLFDSINYLAVLLAAAAHMALGAVWYSRLLFGRAWMSAAGRSEDDIKGGGGAIALALPVALIMAVSLAMVQFWVGIDGWVGGLIVAGVLWLGFAATAHLLLLIFEGRGFKLFAINAGYLLISYLVMGAIIGAL